MIFFVWSLVLSTVQFARRQRLVSVLSDYFIWSLSHNSILLCRKIPFFSCFSKNARNSEQFSGTLDTLRKTNSEPCILDALVSRPIYRTEEVEFVIQPDATVLDIVDWNIFTPPVIHGTIPRVHFIAFLDKNSNSNEHIEMINNSTDIDLFDSTNEQPLITNNTVCSSILIGNLCNKIAHRRGRPWEILYECTLCDFYDIAFAWSQNILFDIGGKALVKMMKVITLPETFFLQSEDCNSLKRSISPPLSSHGSLSPEPLSLLELLYEREHSNIAVDKDFCQDFHYSPALALFHNNESTLQLPVNFPSSSCFESITKTNSRSRTCSVSPQRTQSFFTEAAPFYIRYLKEQNKTSSLLPRRSRSHRLDRETKNFILPEEEIVHPSMNSLIKEEKLQKRNDFISDESSIALTKNASDQINNLSSANDITFENKEKVDGVVEFERSRMIDIGRQDQVQAATYQRSNKMDDPLIKANLIQDKTITVQLQSNEGQISDLIPGYSEQVQVESNHESFTRKFRHCTSVNENVQTLLAQKYHYFIPQLHSQISLTSENACRDLSSASASIPSPSLLQNPEQRRSGLFDKEMFRIFSGSMHRHLHTTANGEKIQTKPLMILVFTGNSDDLFNRILETLSKMIPFDTHTIVHLSYEAFCNHPWIGQGTACLIVADTSHLDDKCWIRLQQYFSNSGKILFLCQNKLLASLSACDNSKKTAKLLKMAFGERQSKKLGKDFEHFLKKTLKTLYKEKKVNQTFHAKDVFGGCKYSVVLNKTEDSPLLLYMENAAQRASALFSDATSEQLLQSGSVLIADALSRLSIKITPNVTLPSITSGYFICEYDRMPWDMEGMHFNEPFGSMPKLLLKQISKHGPLPEVSSELLPIEVRTRVEHLPDFDDEIYFKRLETPRLGKALFYVPVCETTMDIGKSLAFAMPEEPVVIVARQQIKGKGRLGNQWLSPDGCAMFSFNYMLPSESSLCNNIGIIQHIFCVAIVAGVCSLRKELENFPLKIKWPNDLYYGRSYKLGGLIVNATTVNGKTVCTLGAGLNLSNSKPTVCINDLLPGDLRIRQEDYISNTLNKFQYYMDLYESKGVDEFLKHYYRFWLHSREEVTLSDTNEKVIIRGLDHYGFLKVRSRQSGKVMVVHPDGNTFDMMKGLITAKYA